MENKAQQSSSRPGVHEYVNLLDILVVLARKKKLILGVPFAAAVVAAIYSLTLPNIFTGSAKILPPQQSQSTAAAMLGQLGALSGLAGNSLGIKNPADLYVGMLASRAVGDKLIERFKLASVYKTELPSETRDALADASNFLVAKDGMIVIDVDDRDPKRAAAMANAYAEELQKLTQSIAVTEAAQRRLFFETQLRQAKAALGDAEGALRRVQERTGLIQLQGQSVAAIQAAAELKAQIGAREVSMGAMRTFATTSNPEYLRLQQELNGLRLQLTKVETGMNTGKGDVSVATSKVPELGLEYVRRVRDVKYQEAIFELLAKQFEIAKIDEAKDSSATQVLDVAVEPDKKTGPKRSVIVLLTAIMSGFLTVCWVLMREAVGKAKGRLEPHELAQWRVLREHLGLK